MIAATEAAFLYQGLDGRRRRTRFSFELPPSRLDENGARFELATGRCRTPQIGPVGELVTHEVRVVDGQVEVALSQRPVTEPLT